MIIDFIFCDTLIKYTLYSAPVYNPTSYIQLLFTDIISTFVTSKVTTMNTRLKQFLAAENISQSQFADTIKVVRASVSHVLAGRNKPGYDFIKAIMTAYPRLNMEWLIVGKGKMYKSGQDFNETAQSPVSAQIRDSREDEFPQLFDYDDTPGYDDDLPPQEMFQSPSEDISSYAQPSAANAAQIEEVKAKIADPQRKAIKVVIFFNDGTYQEM